MAIPIKKEPAWVTKECRNLHEKCIFCKKSTMFWHLETNNPICEPCALEKEVIDLPKQESKKP